MGRVLNLALVVLNAVSVGAYAKGGDWTNLAMSAALTACWSAVLLLETKDTAR